MDQHEKFTYIENDPEDKSKRCIIRFTGKHFIKRSKYDDLLAHVFKTMSNAILFTQLKGYDTFDIYADLEDVKPANLDFGFSKDFVVMVQQLFPDRLNKCHFIKSPNCFRIFFEALLPFIDNKSRVKYNFITQKPTVVKN